MGNNSEIGIKRSSDEPGGPKKKQGKLNYTTVPFLFSNK
jgi:hypothetical protein